MRFALMQPYFFPYLGYFGLIKHVDRYVLFDTVQHIRHGWVDRNRILKQSDGWLYIRPALKPHSHRILIRDLELDNQQSWKDKLLSQLVTYKRLAPRYWAVRRLVEECLHDDVDTLVAFNQQCLTKICAHLGIGKPIEVLSDLNLTLPSTAEPDEWGLVVCQAIGGVNEYWNAAGGEEFFDRSKYEQAGIAISFFKQNLRAYKQGERPFEPGLSIIDVLMFNEPDEINAMLDDYVLG